MKFMLIQYENAEAMSRRDDPAQMGAYMGAWGAYAHAIAQSGCMVSGAGLLPPRTATTVRVGPAGRDVQDGPFAETKEMLGGFFIIDVPDLDAALAWAARSPAASAGSVEVRPVMPPVEGAAPASVQKPVAMPA